MKLVIGILVTLFFTINLLAANDLHFAPPHLDDQGLVFIDLTSAHYDITYDVGSGKTKVLSTLKFQLPKKGMPIFDSYNDIKSAKLNDQAVSVQDTLVDGGITTILFVEKTLNAGSHTLVLETEIASDEYEGNIVLSSFNLSDLTDRKYLERYVPANLEYDKFKQSFNIEILETSKDHELFINCPTRKLGRNKFKAECPAYYNGSMLFYHIFPKGHFQTANANYTSIDGRVIPIKVHSNATDPQTFVRNTLEILQELENDYGPYPHEHVLILGARFGFGGMEYAGATVTELFALGHELHHCYFARNMHPTLGNHGWIDEALASWRDKGYKSKSGPGWWKTSMAGHSPYRRTTDRKAYSTGANYMAYLNGRFESQGGLKVFLKDWFSKNKGTGFTTDIFQKEMERFYNEDLSDFFNDYIYGRGSRDNHFHLDVFDPSFDYHPELTQEQIKNLIY